MGEHGRWLRGRRRRGRWRNKTRARQALEVLARMMDFADPQTSEHSSDVADLVPLVAGVLGLSDKDIEEIELAARFHDIGKVAVPAEVLRKPGPLDELERELMACHVEWGAELLRHLPDCGAIAHIVRHHHERFDGRGYPDGLTGGDIPLGSRIIAACDAYGAMISDRPYRPALAEERAVDELVQGAGTQFDPRAVAAVLRVVRRPERSKTTAV